MTDFPMQGYAKPHSDTYAWFLRKSSHKKYRDAAIDGIDTFLAGFKRSNVTRASLGTTRDMKLEKRGAREARLTSLYVESAKASFADHPQPIAIDKYDEGLLGIVSKMIAVRADVYLSGEPHTCSRISNYAGMIVRERVKAIKAGAKLRSAVEYFGPLSPNWRSDRYDVDL